MKANKPIETLILTLRGQKVILDADLAELYGVPTFRFNEAFKRNRERFPDDFVFQLTSAEFAALKSQSVTSNSSGGHDRCHELIAICDEFEAIYRKQISHAELVTICDQFPQASRGGISSVGLHRTWRIDGSEHPAQQTSRGDDCLRVAMSLRLPVISDGKLPVPIDMIALNPVVGAAFTKFRIQTMRNTLEDNEPTPFVAGDDPFDENFGNFFFSLYGVETSGILEHIADRQAYKDVLGLAQKLAPSIAFPISPTFMTKCKD
jgi:hypothetical protein